MKVLQECSSVMLPIYSSIGLEKKSNEDQITRCFIKDNNKKNFIIK